jgi:hypothetical protein
MVERPEGCTKCDSIFAIERQVGTREAHTSERSCRPEALAAKLSNDRALCTRLQHLSQDVASYAIRLDGASARAALSHRVKRWRLWCFAHRYAAS